MAVGAPRRGSGRLALAAVAVLADGAAGGCQPGTRSGAKGYKSQLIDGCGHGPRAAARRHGVVAAAAVQQPPPRGRGRSCTLRLGPRRARFHARACDGGAAVHSPVTGEGAATPAVHNGGHNILVRTEAEGRSFHLFLTGCGSGAISC